MKDDIFQKNSKFYYKTTAQCNVLVWNVVVWIIYKNKNNLANLKNHDYVLEIFPARQNF
jgi:hypothetical protein